MGNMPEVKTETQETDTSVDETQKVSDADIKLNNAINAAVKSHLKRSFSKDLPEMFAKLLDERGLSKSKELIVEEVESDEDQIQTKTAKQSGKVKEVEDLKTRKELEALKAELKAEKQATKQKEVMADVKGLLADKVRPDALNTVLKLISHDKMVQIAKDGTISFKHEDEEYDLEEGLSVWLKSKDAALFLPAPSGNSKNVAKRPGFKPLNRTDKTNGSDKQDPRQKTIEMLQKQGLSLGS